MISHKPNIYDDPAAYDLMFGEQASDDVLFYLKQIKKHNGPVLELACGTGRVSIPLAESGCDVTGLDIEEGMLNLAKQKAADNGVSVDWVLGDASDFDLNRKFDVILYPANAILHLLDTGSIEACFSCVSRHLTDDGVFILHVFNPLPRVFTRDPEKYYPAQEYDDPNGKGHVVITEKNIYDRAKQINHITWHYTFVETGDEVIKDLPMRIIYPQELDSLLRHNGFEIVHKYGGFDGSPFTSDSPLQIPICRKAGEQFKSSSGNL